MDGAEVRKMKDDEIKLELARLRTRLYDLRAQSVTDKVGDTSQYRSVRKDVARLLTERRARQIAKHGATARPAAAAPAAKGRAKAPTRAATGAKAAMAAAKAGSKAKVGARARARAAKA